MHIEPSLGPLFIAGSKKSVYSTQNGNNSHDAPQQKFLPPNVLNKPTPQLAHSSFAAPVNQHNMI